MITHTRSLACLPVRNNATTLTSLLIRLAAAALLVFAVVGAAHAQSAFYLGAQAGVNGSKFRFTEDLLELYPTNERLPGVSVGLETGFQLGAWSFGTGLQYLQKGGNYQSDVYEVGDGRTAFLSARERLHFLSVPVLLGYSDYLTDRIGYTVQAGPSFSFGIKGRLDETTEFFGEEETDFQNYTVAFGNGVNDDYRGMQAGFQLAPQLFFDLTRHHRLTLNATWDFGVKDAYNPRYKAANDFFRDFRGTVTNRMAAVTVGYQYRLPFADRY